MTIQQQLAALITGGLTGVGARFYPLTAPDQVVRPYATYQRVSANSENSLSGNTGLINTRMQIDVYADTYSQAQSIAAQIDALMSGWAVQNTSQGAQDLYEDAVKLHRVNLDFSIWHT